MEHAVFHSEKLVESSGLPQTLSTRAVTRAAAALTPGGGTSHPLGHSVLPRGGSYISFVSQTKDLRGTEVR